MSLNKWLCKYFDSDDKGYVTIGDVGNEIYKLFVKFVTCAFIALIISAILYVCYRGIIFISYSIKMGHLPYEPVDEIGFFGTMIFIICGVILCYFAWIHISSIKIAKCPLKEEKP